MRAGLLQILAATAIVMANSAFADIAFGQTSAAPPVVAGSIVPNVAAVTVSSDAARSPVSSNIANLRIDELLDIGLSSDVETASFKTGEGSIAFSLTNSGNGNESFALDVTIDQVPATLVGFALDQDGDGTFDRDVDPILTEAATPLLSPGEAVPLLIVLQSDASGQGSVALAAAAITGSGSPGLAFAGQGDDGSDAVVGLTRAAATIDFALTIAATRQLPLPTLLKSQQVLASDGSSTPTPGAIVIYNIVAEFTGTELLRAARFTDPIPDGTTYVPGSLQLDGTPLTDAADNDIGRFDGSRVNVDLGDVAGPATKTIQFQVKLD